MSQSDNLSITCPKCGDTHKYKLDVKRSYSISFKSRDNRKSTQTKMYFTRLFTCPETDKDFQARFWMVEESDAPILSLELEGLDTDSTDE